MACRVAIPWDESKGLSRAAWLEDLKELALVVGRVDWKDVQMENAQVVRSDFESVHAKDMKLAAM
jgi:hypothetical protein